MAFEIERKYLIEKIDAQVLKSMGAKVFLIEQSYLVPNIEYPVRRIRKVACDNKVTYFYTLKRPAVGTFTREEVECEIAENQYLELQKERDFGLNTIKKNRFKIREGGRVYEIDVFPFFSEFDVLEIELQSEDEQVTIPSYLKIIEEVTFDERYTNYSLAKRF